MSGDGYLVPQADNLRHQLNGMRSPDFQKALDDLQTIKPDEVLQILSTTPENPTGQDQTNAQNLIDRASKAKKLFTLLADNPDVAAKMINPTLNGEHAFTTDEVNQGRMQLYQKLNTPTTQVSPQ